MDVLFLSQDPVQGVTLHLVARLPRLSGPWQFFSPELFFMTLRVFRHTGQASRETSPNLGLSVDFFMIRLGLWVFVKNAAEAFTHHMRVCVHTW